MLNKFHEKQQGMELIILEQLVPQDHLLRKIDRSIDFSFIRRLCAPLYSANLGRPAIEPEVLFRMLFVGYLYGIRSERRLEEEINYIVLDNLPVNLYCAIAFRSVLFLSGGVAASPCSKGKGFREWNGKEWVLDKSVIDCSLLDISLFNCVGFSNQVFPTLDYPMLDFLM